MAWIRGMGVYLAAQLAIFVIIKLIFRAAWGDLVGPYFAFSASIMTTLLMMWIVKTFARGKPRHFALGSSVTIAFLALSANGAWAYLGLVLGLISPQFVGDWTNWAFIVLPLTLFPAIAVYQSAYRSARAINTNIVH